MSTRTFNIVVLISGRGSNLKSLIEKAGHYTITAVISDKPDAPGLDFARDAGIPARGFQRAQFSSLLQHKQAIYQLIEQHNHDLIVLAGFMQILETGFVQKHRGRIINIHPSLLPDFKGLNTHKRAINRFVESKGKNNIHGCSVHFVHHKVDSGPLIAQAPCTIDTHDTEAQLAAKVLEYEHRIFPWVINQVAQNRIRYEAGSVYVNTETAAEGRSLGFIIND